MGAGRPGIVISAGGYTHHRENIASGRVGSKVELMEIGLPVFGHVLLRFDEQVNREGTSAGVSKQTEQWNLPTAQPSSWQMGIVSGLKEQRKRGHAADKVE